VEVEPVRTFFGQGEKGSIFRDFVRASFMDGPFPEILALAFLYVTRLVCI